MLVIGICGASGSGKSTLAGELAAELGADCYVLNYDCYYSDHPSLNFEERCALNYDEPGIFDHDVVLSDVRALAEGRPITRKAYDFSRHRRCDTSDLIFPPKVLIIEGIHSFYSEELRDLMFLRLYVSVDPDECLLRRIGRDIKERGRDIDSISAQYRSTVKPMYEKYIRDYQKVADMTVTCDGSNSRVLRILMSYIRQELAQEDAAR